MRQRNVLSNNEWEGWLQWIKAAFSQGAISDYWKESIQPEKWYDPAFRVHQQRGDQKSLKPLLME